MTTTGAILLVEDNEDDVFLMQRALKAAGITNPVHIAEDGQAAINYLSGVTETRVQGGAALPALIFLDLKLPFVSGLDLLAWIRQDWKVNSPVVVVLTSSEEPSDLSEAYRLGANSYLVKPPTTSQLFDMAKTFKTYWFDYNKFDLPR